MKGIMISEKYIRNGVEYDFEFCTDFGIYDKLIFVDSVVSTIVTKDNYYPFIRDLMFDFYLIDVFTNVDVSTIKKSDKVINEIEKFLEETNIVDIMKIYVDESVIEELNNAIDDNIEYITGIHKNKFMDNINSLLKAIEKKLNNADIDSMAKLASNLNEMYGQLTPEKLIEAYAESDLFKQKYANIQAERNGELTTPKKTTTRRKKKEE